jgi:hypothetical protein
MKKILLRRGLLSNLPTLEVGEAGFVTDTGKLYIGNTGGNVLINQVTSSDVASAISSALTSYATNIVTSNNNNINMDSSGHTFIDANYDGGYSIYLGGDHPTNSYVGGVIIGDHRGGYVNIQTKRLIVPNTVPPLNDYGAIGDIKGTIAFDNSYIYYCTSNYVNNQTPIWQSTPWSAATEQYVQDAIADIPAASFTGYDNEIHVSSVDGNDTTGNGDILNPVASITKALTLITGGRRTIVVHPGTYTENPTTLVTNTTIATTELTGANTLLLGTLTLGAAARISGLKMSNLTISTDGNAYISNCTVDTQLIKSGSGYTEIINSELQCSSGCQFTGAGQVFINGNKIFAPSVSNASASVTIRGANQVVTPSVTAGTLAIENSVVVSASPDSNAITTSASTNLVLANSFVLNSTGTSVERIALSGFYSILNVIYDKPNSTLVSPSGTGGSTSSISYFQHINADRLILAPSGQITFPDNTVQTSANILWSISASGSSSYTFSGPGIVSGNTNNPVLHLQRGSTYTFVNTTGTNHPFAIRVSNGGAAYTSGVSGSQTGTQTFTVPMDAPSTLYYQCTIHSAMGNTINVIDAKDIYGCFHKLASLTAPAADTVYNFDWYTDTTVHESEGVTVTSSNPTRISIAKSGKYSVFTEMIVRINGSGERNVFLWLAKNGTDIPETGVKVSLKQGGADNPVFETLSKQWFLDDINANDYIELRYALNRVDLIQLEYTPAQTEPYIRPAIPSATITIIEV